MGDLSVKVTCVVCLRDFWVWPDDPRAGKPAFMCRECEGKPRPVLEATEEGYCEVCRGPCMGH